MFIKENSGYILLGILGLVVLLKYTGIFDRFNDKKSALGTSNKNVANKNVANKNVANKNNDDFMESKTFNGERKGYVFKTGGKGTGYYVD